MFKINKSRKSLMKASILLLGSIMLTPAYKSNVDTVYAYEEDQYESINNDFDNCSFPKNIIDILKEIKEHTKDDIVLRKIDCAFDEGESSDYFIAQAICSFAQENEKIKYQEAYEEDQYNPYYYINYSIDDIAIIDNLNMQKIGLPKQLCLLTKICNFGGFSLYEMYSDEPCYVITTRAGYVLTVSTGYEVKEIKIQTIQLTPIKDFLVENDMFDKVENKYSYLDLFEGLTYEISEKLSNYSSSDNVRVKDVLVIDTTKSLTNSSNKNQDYYFIKYAYPYLFINGNKVYKDVSNLDAKVIVDDLNTLKYFDKEANMSLFDLDYHFIDGDSSTSCLVKLHNFLRVDKSSLGLYVTDDFLKNMNDIYNEKELSKIDTYSLNKKGTKRLLVKKSDK